MTGTLDGNSITYFLSRKAVIRATNEAERTAHHIKRFWLLCSANLPEGQFNVVKQLFNAVRCFGIYRWSRGNDSYCLIMAGLCL